MIQKMCVLKKAAPKERWSERKQQLKNYASKQRETEKKKFESKNYLQKLLTKNVWKTSIDSYGLFNTSYFTKKVTPEKWWVLKKIISYARRLRCETKLFFLLKNHDTEKNKIFNKETLKMAIPTKIGYLCLKNWICEKSGLWKKKKGFSKNLTNVILKMCSKNRRPLEIAV